MRMRMLSYLVLEEFRKILQSRNLFCCIFLAYFQRWNKHLSGLLPHSPDIGQISDGSVSDFRISGQSLVKINCHNSRTSGGIDMKLEPVSKLDKKAKKHQKKLDNDAMLENWSVIVIFSIYSQFGAIRKRDSGCIVNKTYILIKSNLLSYKNWKQE